MAGEDTILTRVSGRPTVATIEDNTHRYTNATNAVAVGDVVRVSASDTVAKADVDAVPGLPPIGVVQSLDGDSACYVVHSGGIATGYSGLNPSVQYYLSTTAGGLVATAGEQGKKFLVGVAINSTDLLVCCIPVDLHAITADAQPSLQFIENGTEVAKIWINDSDNLKIRTQISNKSTVFETNDGGTVREALRVRGNSDTGSLNPEVVVNEGSNSLVDFRVESDLHTHMLFVDGGSNYVGVAASSPTSILHVGGAIATSIAVKTSNYTITVVDSTILLDASSAGVTITLPAVSGIAGRIYTVKCIAKTGMNVADLATNASEEIDGSSSAIGLFAGQSVTVQCTGSGWVKIAEVLPPI
jgi:hypothetical protein